VREPYWCDTQHLSGVQLVVPTGKGYREMTCTLFADCVIFFLEIKDILRTRKHTIVLMLIVSKTFRSQG
jgi:hypothetical protein